MTKILITGGYGFMGQAIAKRAHRLGLDVTLLDIIPAKMDSDFHFIQGDVTSLKSLLHSFHDQDCVIHAAANPNLWSKSSQDLMTVNYQGTLNVLQACQALNIPKLIHISSDCTLVSPTNKVITENSQTHFKDMKGTYCQSKWLAEKEVMSANCKDFSTFVINPGIPIGMTHQKAPFVQMLQAFMAGHIKGTISGNLGLIHIDDLSEITLKVLTHGEKGNRYLGVGDVWSLDKVFSELARMVHRAPPKWHIPLWLAKVSALCEQSYARCSKHQPLATLAGIYLAQHTQHIDTRVTQERLQVQFSPIEPALNQMLLPFKSNV